MKKFAAFCLLLFPVFALAQTPAIWTRVSSAKELSAPKVNRSSFPSAYALFELDLQAFKQQLAGVPVRGDGQARGLHTVFLPSADGMLAAYDVIETPIMEPELQRKFPDIRSYAAQGLTDPTAVARFSVTQFGLHSMTMSSGISTVFIDPYTEDRKTYIVYEKAALSVADLGFACMTDESDAGTRANREFRLDSNDKKLRTYRLALSCNGEYATLFKGTGTVAQQKANVQAQMAITMTRVNGVYEKDLAITMVFVANNDQIIYLDAATDPWASEFNTMTAQTIDAVIGVANYDIGHNFNTTGGGNAGCIGCVCSSTSQTSFHKGRGYTGRSNPTGDAFDIDYVAHEMGHQFGGYHTQSNNSCRSGNNTEVETGSGSSIMGYAGICAANVQSNSDDYFAYVNIRDISANVQSGVSSSCAQITNFTNNPPTANAGRDYTIPKSTPFLLTATGSDPDGNAITYCWEQRDPEAVLPTAQNNAAPTATRTAGPMFRTLPGTTSPTRYFPSLSTILTGATSNTWEVLPSIARTFNFSVTVRDNVAGGGQTASDLMVVNVNGTAGPFLVTAPNTTVSWAGASNQTVTWDVAGTTANNINCAYVDIYLSTDGGLTFPTLLASKVPNDGSELVTLPATTGTTNRIMVRGNGNIFFDVSNTHFTTTAPGSTFALSFAGGAGGQNKAICQGVDTSFSFDYSTTGGFSGTTTLTVAGVPTPAVVNLSQSSVSAPGNVTLAVTNTGGCAPGLYPITVTGTSGAVTKSVRFYIEILNANFATPSVLSPANEAFGQSLSPTLSWAADAAATSYLITLATDADLSQNVQTFETASNSLALSGLSNHTNYFWTIQPKNSGCHGSVGAVSRFTTGTVSCATTASTNVPIAISAGAASTVNSTLNVTSTSLISDVNVSVQLTHTWVADLTLTLISPTGTQIQLVSGKCSSNDDINAVFDDAGVTLVCGATPTISGSVKPAQLLSALNGQSPAGTWTLRVADTASGDGGSLNAWSLNICSQTTTQVACGEITTNWNGASWDNGVPQDNVAATISGDFVSTKDVEACSLDVVGTSAVTIQSGHDLIVDGAVSVAPTASLTLENNANLLQVKDVANTGITRVKRAATMRRLDYVFWSSPVGGQDLKVFSPKTVSPSGGPYIGGSRFYVLNEPTNSFVAIEPVGTPFAKAKGYMIRAPNDFPANGTQQVFNGLFSSVPNNGTATIATTRTPGTGYGYNLIGNPYPSTLNASLFLAQNPGSLYFWTHTSQNPAMGSNYASYTNFGVAAAAGGAVPDGTIAVGQGFILETAASGTATFTNAMRTSANQAIFFREANTDRSRLWLNLSNQDGLQNQILVGYADGATMEADVSMDAPSMEENINCIASLIDGKRYSIQARPTPFDTNDEIPLGFKATAAGTFTISLFEADGVFADGDVLGQVVYLKDTATGTVHDLTETPYTFGSAAGDYADRFSIVYQNTALQLPDPTGTPRAVVFKQEQHLQIETSGHIEHVIVYDILGRRLYETVADHTTRFVTDDLRIQNQPIVVRVKIDGRTVVKKIVF